MKYTVPSWVPTAVKRIAPLITCDDGVKKRLLTDPYMEEVWSTLKRANVDEEALRGARGHRTLGDYDLPDYDISLGEQACAAIFAFAALDLTIGSRMRDEDEDLRKSFVVRNVDKTVDALRSAADWCSRVDQINGRPRVDSVLANHLAEAKAFLLKVAEDYSSQSKNPLFLKNSKGRDADHLRVSCRFMAAEMKRFYGSPHCGTTATLVRVTLDLDAELDAESVRNWCADLT